MNGHRTAPEPRCSALSAARGALLDRLQAERHIGPGWAAAVRAVPRERFLSGGVFLPEAPEGHAARWRPVTPDGLRPEEWAELAYSDQSLVTQLDGTLTPDRATGPVEGYPTSSSTAPATVVGMLEELEVRDGDRVLEIGTGTGYSTALLCHRLGEDNVTTVEADPELARRADDALEVAGYSTWTVTDDGLLGHPSRAPYDRIIATCAVRRIPHTWLRQARPGAIVLATVGSWAYGTGLAKVVVAADGTAAGRVTGPSSFMPARAQAAAPLGGSLAARAAYADSVRRARVAPGVLRDWMPAFLAQLAAPTAQLVRAVAGGTEKRYLIDAERESFAELAPEGDGWVVRQGGPLALWDAVERAITGWRAAGEPGIDAVRLRVTREAHTYWIDAPGHLGLRWEHRHPPLP
ncbi:methyltransferase [Streptomyces sp. AC536]|uniref:ATP-grasp peptide maturase system methyltransferase n=1 Tax=Streptomyces buecherae TaxID=2763006 RepID=UPI00164E465B|nr:ATP-grasp peptide maturase system methyltransferase [Streptomyces buecherae]MBC3981610.1 methyltransferase [Streptomyces buecherae]QNJ40513.1 methyltransferase [Streptomyces buecherae]